jgi:hypothetical protein
MLSAWRHRFWLGGLLFFGSEIVLWTQMQREWLEWLLIGGGYLALAALTLEAAAFFRARSVFEALALAGVIGLANGLLLNPSTALVDLPRTLVTRAMGAHALMALAMIGAFTLIVGARRTPALRIGLGIGALGLGLFWGVWARWSPTELVGQPETPLAEMLGAGALVLAALVALARWLPTASIPRLNRLDWTLCLGALLALLIVRLVSAQIGAFALIAAPLLIAYCLAVLYFRQRKKPGSFMDAGASAPAWGWAAAAAAIFLGAGALGYHLPRQIALGDLLALLAVAFTAYGLVWLPCVSLVLGAQAFSRRARGFRL